MAFGTQAIQETSEESQRKARLRAARPSPPGVPQQLRDVVAETRNVLVLVQAYAERLEDRYDDPAFRNELCSFIAQAFERVDGALDRLELASARRSARAEAIDLSDEITRLLDLHWSEWMGRPALLGDELGPGLPKVWADRAQLSEALGSLLSVVLALGEGGKDVSIRGEAVAAPDGDVPGVHILVQAPLASTTEDLAALPELRLAETLIGAQSGSLEVRVLPGPRLRVRIILPSA
jgi:nitrogen-specific signal transduction histidine kinase